MAPMAEYDKLEVVTEEVVICKLLTSNDLKVRKRGLSSLKKWFKKIGSKKGLQEDDFNRIWSGLFYYFWMSDKPLVQEEAAEFISGMVHVIDNFQASMFYVRGFFNSIVKQWDRISHYRIDKFLMFVRRFLRQILVLLMNHEWDIEKLELFSTELYNAIQILPYSLALHLNEIFNEEVAKISKGKIPTEALVTLYKGFFECIVNLRPSMQVINSIQTNIFGGLARQLKLYIKQKALADDCDNEKNDENDAGSGDEAVNTSALDPRPGGVDVFLPFIEFDEKIFVNFMEEYTSKQIPTKARNILNQLIAMFSSITKLRATVSDTDKLIREMQDNPKKRKRPKQTLSKLIKQSCRKLEEEDEESEAEHDERILKKLRSLTDLIQVPAGKSTFTVAQAKINNTEPKRTSISNEWTVTETVDKPSPAKKAKISGSKNDWVVEETTPKSVEKLTDKTNKKSPASFSVQEITPKGGEKSADKTNKKSPSSFSVQEITPKSVEKSITKTDKKSPASFTVQEITPKSGEKSITKADKKSPASFTVQEITPKGGDKSSNKSPKKSPRLVPQESSVTSNENISDHESEIANEPIEKMDDEVIDETDICLEIADSPVSLSKQPAVISPEKRNEENEPSSVSEPINTEGVEFIEKSEDVAAATLDDVEKSTSPSPKKPLSVSFSENPAVSYYEDSKKDQNCDTESEIIVPASVVKSNPKLMKENRDYVVVDFKPQPEDEKELTREPEKESTPEPEKESDDQPTELETITRVLRSRKVESTPVPSTPEPKRTRKPREKKAEPSSQSSQSQRAEPSSQSSQSQSQRAETPSQSQRKSTRIAEKQKKVLFKLEENTYQDVKTYQKELKSKPASPFDSSKLPASGILKPYAVTSPINPFYFANGERKLKRKRRRN